MRFNNENYLKVFPRENTPETVETAVPTFTPTTDKLNGEDKPDVVVEASVDVPAEEGVDNGNVDNSVGNDN